MTRLSRFDVVIGHNGHSLHAKGEIYPGRPARGPSYACGGEPEEYPEISSCDIWLVRGKRERKLEDPDGELSIAIEDAVFEALRDADDEAQYNHAEAMMDERKPNIPEDQFDR